MVWKAAKTSIKARPKRPTFRSLILCSFMMAAVVSRTNLEQKIIPNNAVNLITLIYNSSVVLIIVHSLKTQVQVRLLNADWSDLFWWQDEKVPDWPSELRSEEGVWNIDGKTICRHSRIFSKRSTMISSRKEARYVPSANIQNSKHPKIRENVVYFKFTRKSSRRDFFCDNVSTGSLHILCICITFMRLLQNKTKVSVLFCGHTNASISPNWH